MSSEIIISFCPKAGLWAVHILIDSSNDLPQLPAFVYRVKINATDVYCIIDLNLFRGRGWEGATIETTGPRIRKTLLHKGGFGSLSNTWCLLSNANKKHGSSAFWPALGLCIRLLGFLLLCAVMWHLLKSFHYWESLF